MPAFLTNISVTQIAAVPHQLRNSKNSSLPFIMFTKDLRGWSSAYDRAPLVTTVT
jgi:hypothetical protein